MDNFPGWTVRFELMYRQEQSVHASGRVRVKDFGTPLWRASYQSRPLRPNLLDEWRARLAALENGLLTFQAWPMSRCWPQAHPYGVGAVNGEIATLGSDNQSLTVAWNDEATTLRIGDYATINGNRLHQVTGVAGAVLTVAPHFSAGVLIGQSVDVSRPSVAMAIVPGSVSTTSGLNGRGTVSFEAMEARG